MFGNVFIDIAIYALLFVIIGCIDDRNEKESHRIGNICYVIICAIILFYSLFRHPLTGTDSYNNYKAVQVIWQGGTVRYEYLYRLYVTWISHISVNYVVFLRITTLFILLPLFYVIYKMPYRSFILLLFVLGELNATFDVIRGFVSFSFIFMGYYLYNYRKKKAAVILYVVAIFIHITAIYYPIVFLCSNVIKKKRELTVLSFAGVIAYIFVNMNFSKILSLFIDRIAGILGNIAFRFYSYIGTVRNEADFSASYIVLYLLAVILGIYYYPDTALKQNLSEGKINNNKSQELRNVTKLANMNWLFLFTAIISAWLPVLHRYLKLSMIFTYVFIGFCLKKEARLRNRIIILGLVFAVNMYFTYINNGGFVYKFYFNNTF